MLVDREYAVQVLVMPVDDVFIRGNYNSNLKVGKQGDTRIMKNLKKNKGQGVIEYAGALVIAAVLVAAVLAVGPDGIEGLFTAIMDTVEAFFQGELDGLSA